MRCKKCGGYFEDVAGDGRRSEHCQDCRGTRAVGSSLTPRQAEVLDAIRAFKAKEDMMPTHRELGDLLGIASTNGIADHLRALARKGYVELRPLKSRAIRVLLDDHGAPVR